MDLGLLFIPVRALHCKWNTCQKSYPRVSLLPCGENKNHGSRRDFYLLAVKVSCMMVLLAFRQRANALGTQDFPYLFPSFIKAYHLQIRAKGAVCGFLRPRSILSKYGFLSAMFTFSHKLTSYPLNLKSCLYKAGEVYHNSHLLASMMVNYSRGSL